MTSAKKRIERLSDEKRELLATRLGLTTDSKLVAEEGENRRLVAYLIAEHPAEELGVVEKLRKKVPGYMVPSQFVQLKEFPRLPNGKIDKLSLSPHDAGILANHESGFEPPRTEVERRLVSIWQEILDFEPVGINDNFFEIGGDSILSIQIVSRARTEGIALAANQIFEYPTISQLADSVDITSIGKGTEDHIGKIGLVPIQRQIVECIEDKRLSSGDFVVFDVPELLSFDTFRSLIEKLIRRHSALRSRFSSESGDLSAFIAAPDEVDPVARIDLTSISPNKLEDVIEQNAQEISSSADFYQSPFQALYFECPEATTNKALIAAHRLIFDIESWYIILEDLERISDQLRFEPKIGNGFNEDVYDKWIQDMISMSSSQELEIELSYWSSQCSSRNPAFTDSASISEDKKLRSSVSNSLFYQELTPDQLAKSNRAYNTKTEELILTGLIQALCVWLETEEILLGMNSQLRETYRGRLNLSSMVGCLTSYFPLAVPISDPHDLRSNILTVKETLRNVPHGGIGFGVLNNLNAHNNLKNTPSVTFGFLGEIGPFESRVLGNGRLVETLDSGRIIGSADSLNIGAFVLDHRLYLNIVSSEQLLESNEIENLARLIERELRVLSDHCIAKTGVEYTPSDFPDAGLDKDDLDQLVMHLE